MLKSLKPQLIALLIQEFSLIQIGGNLEGTICNKILRITSNKIMLSWCIEDKKHKDSFI